MSLYIDAKPRVVIPIGMSGDNEARTVRFDVSKWESAFGTNGSYQAIHKRATDTAAYPVVVTAENGVVKWEVSASDTSVVGSGSLQLMYFVGTTLAHSETYVTRVVQGISETVNVPSPYTSWVNNVLAAGSAAQSSATSAATSATNAGTYKDSASASAASAASSASAASASASSAAASASSVSGVVSAAEAAKTAAQSAQAAAESAKDTAVTSASTATTKASEASASASSASTSAQTATTKAGEAASSAQSAATTLSNATTTINNAKTTAIGEVNSTKTAAIAAVDAAKDADVATVNALIASIPEDYSELSETVASQSEAMTTLNAKLKSGSEQDAEYHLGFYLDENGDLCQVETEG